MYVLYKTNMKTQPQIKQIGIWLDHSQAYFFHPDERKEEMESVDSQIVGNERERGHGADGIRLGGYRSTNNEHHKHQREQNELHIYYKELIHQLHDYDEIYLFGSGTARNELYNLMKEDAHFKAKKIHVAAADHLSENQMREQVNNYFSIKE